MGIKDKIWVEKYSPKKFDDYIFQTKLQKLTVTEYILGGVIPNLLLYGVQGTGKTSLAHILITELNMDPTDVLEIDATKERNVDTVRDKITNFVSTMAFGAFKIVLLDEFDYFTPVAQAMLRRTIEQSYDNVRYILTCNYVHKIIPAIRSRMQDEIRFYKPDRDIVIQRIEDILENEKIKHSIDLVNLYVTLNYPDMRKIINTVQQYSIGGTLHKPDEGAQALDYKFKILDLIASDRWEQVRLLIAKNINDEWDEVYRFLYDNIDHSAAFKSNKSIQEQAIVIIAEHIYKHALCADSEINFAACCIRLGELV